MNKLVTSSTAIALFLLAGCAASGPKLASSTADIVGTWHTPASSVELQFNEDGTTHIKTAEGTDIFRDFRFEGTRFFSTDIPNGGCSQIGAQTGIYEVELLANGNLNFTVIEDECPSRVNTLMGALIEREWEPVP